MFVQGQVFPRAEEQCSPLDSGTKFWAELMEMRGPEGMAVLPE